MSRISNEKKSSFVPRITQLDANEFDKEICNVLLSQLMEISKYLKPGALNNIKPELTLASELLIFYYSIFTKNATFGQQLLNLKYNNVLSKTQVTAYALMRYILPYLKNKYEHFSSKFQGIPFPIWNSLHKLEVFVSICSFFNAVFFLQEGKYPTLVDRLLKLSYSPVDKINPSVGYNYMTRELLWHGFMELLMCILPLVNYKSIKRKIMKSFISRSLKIKQDRIIILNSRTKCVVCDDFPTLPCQISTFCPHLACYYCIKSNLLADEKFMCPVCGETNTVNGDLKFLRG